MSIEKSEVRASLAHEIGVTTEDALDSAKGDVRYWEGAGARLLEARKKVQALAVLVDECLDGKGTDPIHDLETAALVKKYVTRAVAVLDSETRHAENQRLIHDGRSTAYGAMVKHLKNIYSTETAAVGQVKARAQQIVKGKPVAQKGARVVGASPGPTVKQRRQAEALAAEMTAKPKRRPAKKRTAKKKVARKKGDAADS